MLNKPTLRLHIRLALYSLNLDYNEASFRNRLNTDDATGLTEWLKALRQEQRETGGILKI